MEISQTQNPTAIEIITDNNTVSSPYHFVSQEFPRKIIYPQDISHFSKTNRFYNYISTILVHRICYQNLRQVDIHLTSDYYTNHILNPLTTASL